MAIIRRHRTLKFKTPKLRRYKVKVQRIGRFRAFLEDFNRAIWAEIKAGIREKVGHTYILMYDQRVIQVRWFWTYKACVKAVQFDVSQGLVIPHILIRMQQGERVASMFHDIRKEKV